jgi:hypothetical protein
MSAEMVAVKISRLTGIALDWAVARALELPLTAEACQTDMILIGTGIGDLRRFSPSSDWNHIGPLILKWRMNFATLGTKDAAGKSGPVVAKPGIPGRYYPMDGQDHMVAASRCIVLAKMSMDSDGEMLIPTSLVTQ